MKLDEYQELAVSTAIYPGTLAYPTLGLCGEAGELSGAWLDDRYDDVQKETGDVLWYVANVADDAGLLLSEVCGRKTFRIPHGYNVFEAFQDLQVQCGKVAENVKKAIRDNDGVLTDARKSAVSVALYGIMRCLASVALSQGFSLHEAAKDNIAKLMSRKERGTLKGDGDDR